MKLVNKIKKNWKYFKDNQWKIAKSLISTEKDYLVDSIKIIYNNSIINDFRSSTIDDLTSIKNRLKDETSYFRLFLDDTLKPLIQDFIETTKQDWKDFQKTKTYQELNKLDNLTGNYAEKIFNKLKDIKTEHYHKLNIGLLSGLFLTQVIHKPNNLQAALDILEKLNPFASTALYCETNNQTTQNNSKGINDLVQKKTINPLLVTKKMKSEEKLNPIYDRILKDIKKNKPIIITSYLSACPEHIFGDGSIQNNLYWTFQFGHKYMFNKTHSSKKIKEISPNTKWTKIYSQTQAKDPQEIITYEATIKPNEFWKKQGITKPFKILHTYLVYQNQSLAMWDLTINTKEEKGLTIKINKNEINLGTESHFTGHWGHNSFFDYAKITLNHIYSEEIKLNKLASEKKLFAKYPQLTKYKSNPSLGLNQIVNSRNPQIEGTFDIGCHTLTIGNIPTKIEGKTDIGFIYTKDFIAPEGYIALSLINSISEGKHLNQIIQNANQTYQTYQKLRFTPKLITTN